MGDQFFGNIQPSLDLDEHEHLGSPGDDSPGARRVVSISPVPDNPRDSSLELEYTGSDVTKLIKTMKNGDVYEKTLTYTDGNLTEIGQWVKV
jgi:hypothetical protein